MFRRDRLHALRTLNLAIVGDLPRDCAETFLAMAAIVDNLIRTTRAAAALIAEEDARKAKVAAVLPIEIFVAGMTGDSEVVLDWLFRGGDINAGEEVTQATLLMAATVTGAALPLEVLIAKGSNIDSRDVHGQTALIFAALYGHAAILRQLAAAGAALHLVCNAGLTAEQHATRAGHWECVCELRALERAQARRSDRKRSRRAAAEDAWGLPEDIAAAAEQGNEEVVLSWLEGGGNIDAAHPQAGCTLLMCASAEGREALVAALQPEPTPKAATEP
jgi:hypothetical protein